MTAIMSWFSSVCSITLYSCCFHPDQLTLFSMSTHSQPKIRNNVINSLYLSVFVCFRPVCPSGDGGGLESSSSSSHLDPLPSFIWPSTSSVSLAGKWITNTSHLSSVRPVDAPVWRCRLSLFSPSRGFVVLVLFGKINSEKHLERCEHSYLPSTQPAILKVCKLLRVSLPFYLFVFIIFTTTYIQAFVMHLINKTYHSLNN